MKRRGRLAAAAKARWRDRRDPQVLALMEQQDREANVFAGDCADVRVGFYCSLCAKMITVSAHANVMGDGLTDEIRQLIAGEVRACHRQQHEKEATP